MIKQVLYSILNILHSSIISRTRSKRSCYHTKSGGGALLADWCSCCCCCCCNDAIPLKTNKKFLYQIRINRIHDPFLVVAEIIASSSQIPFESCWLFLFLVAPPPPPPQEHSCCSCWLVVLVVLFLPPCWPQRNYCIMPLLYKAFPSSCMHPIPRSI